MIKKIKSWFTKKPCKYSDQDYLKYQLSEMEQAGRSGYVFDTERIINEDVPETTGQLKDTLPKWLNDVPGVLEPTSFNALISCSDGYSYIVPVQYVLKSDNSIICKCVPIIAYRDTLVKRSVLIFHGKVVTNKPVKEVFIQPLDTYKLKHTIKH